MEKGSHPRVKWVALGVLAVLALLVALLPEDRSTASPVRPSTPTPPSSVTPDARAQRVTTAPRPSGESRITGLVRDDRGPVAGARVSASRPEPWRTLSELTCAPVQEGQEDLPNEQRDCGIDYRRMVVDLMTAHTGEALVFAEVTTGADGGFVLEGLPEGTVTLWALGDEGAMSQAEVPVGASHVELTLEEGRLIEGQVLGSEDKTPIPNAQVTVIHRQHTRFFDALADAAGHFRVGPLPSGNYSAFVTAEGWAPAFLPDVRTRGAPHSVVLVRSARITGRLVSPAGSPVPGVTVLLDGATPSATEQLTTTDGAGRFSFDSVPSVPHQLSAQSKAADAFATLDMTPPAEDVVLQLQPGLYVEGLVLDDAGHSIAAARVLTYREDGGPASAEATTMTSAAGRYRLGPLRSGPHTFQVEAARHRDVVVVAQMLQPGLGPLDFTLQRAASAEGIVVDETGTPLAGVTVELRGGTDGWDVNRLHDAQRTDASGHFVLDGWSEGPGLVGTPDKAFRNPALPVQVPVTRLRVVLDRGASVAGRVTDPQGLPVRDATVSLWKAEEEGDEGEESPPPGAVTDDLGRFQLRGLGPGRYVLEAIVRRALMDERTSRPVEITAREHVDVTLRLEEGRTLSGVAVDGAGQPLADVRLTATPDGEARSPWREEAWGESRAPSGIRTDKEGRFTLRHLVASRHALQVQYEGYTFRPEQSQGGVPRDDGEALWVDTQAGQVRLVLERDGRVRGRIVDPQGQAVTSFTATLAGDRVSKSQRGSADGTFELTFKDSGSQTLFVQASRAALLERTVSLSRGVDLDLGTLTLDFY